jgi:hypothetical protein
MTAKKRFPQEYPPRFEIMVTVQMQQTARHCTRWAEHWICGTTKPQAIPSV